METAQAREIRLSQNRRNAFNIARFLQALARKLKEQTGLPFTAGKPWEGFPGGEVFVENLGLREIIRKYTNILSDSKRTAVIICNSTKTRKTWSKKLQGELEVCEAERDKVASCPPGQVVLTTPDHAKGLEFDVVVVPEIDTEFSSLKNVLNTKPEKWRVVEWRSQNLSRFFVSASRAKHILVLGASAPSSG